jgi:hypothetical protein
LSAIFAAGWAELPVFSQSSAAATGIKFIHPPGCCFTDDQIDRRNKNTDKQ